MPTMTAAQRVIAAFEHREPDRTPYFEYLLLEPLAGTILGRPYAGDPDHWRSLLDELGWEQAVRRIARDRLDLALALEHDLIYAMVNPPPPARPAPRPADPEDPVERVRLRCERAEQGYKPPPDETFLIYVFLREEMARRGVRLPIFAPAFRHGVWTDTDLMMTMLLDPPAAHRHFRFATRVALARVERLLALGVELIGVGGDFAGNRPLISPEAYRTFIVPEVHTVARVVRAGGARSINASDGNLWSVISDFLIGCEVDAYAEIDFHAGMDLGELKRQFGARITFVGNLDCGNVLSFGTVEEIRAHVHDCLRAGQGNGGHVLCASNAITASVPLRNYLASVDAYRDFFGLPPILPHLAR